MREEIFFAGDYFHIYQRGVDKRRVFMDDLDRQRFYWSLYLFNDLKFEPSKKKRLDRLSQVSVQESIIEIDPRDCMVDIGAFNLLGNHFHLLVRPKNDEALSMFMHRLLVSYAKYFNLRHERSGALFDGPFKATSIRRDAQLQYLPLYIHLNTLDLFGVPWRQGLVGNWGQVAAALDNSEWSSHQTYLSGKQKLPVVDLQVVQDLYPDPKEYEASLRGWSSRYALSNIED